jgi:hypothetical protein
LKERDGDKKWASKRENEVGERVRERENIIKH